MSNESLINDKLSEIAEHSALALKKYIASFEDQLFTVSDTETIKRISAAYYLCAREITRDFDALSALTLNVSAVIDKARAEADEETLHKMLEAFDKILEISRAYEAFLQSSETTISDKKQGFSISALRQSAIALYTKLS